jgi:hypothetical protein
METTSTQDVLPRTPSAATPQSQGVIRVCIQKSNFRQQPFTLRLRRLRGYAQGERANYPLRPPIVRAEPFDKLRTGSATAKSKHEHASYRMNCSLV